MTNPFTQRLILRAARLAVLGLTMAAGLPAMAQRTTIGPFLDYAETITSFSSPGRITKTKLDVEGSYGFISWLDSNGNFGSAQVFSPNMPLTPCGTTQWPMFAFCGSLTFIDRVNISPVNPGANPNGIDVKGLSYISYDYGDGTGQALITTLYGRDIATGSRLQMSGFDSSQPEVTISNEQILGKTGAVFEPMRSATVSVGDLGAMLGPGYDISGVTGDPNGKLYLFQTNVPYVEISSAVPEPTSYALMAGGLAVLSLMRRRRAASSQA